MSHLDYGCNFRLGCYMIRPRLSAFTMGGKSGGGTVTCMMRPDLLIHSVHMYGAYGVRVVRKKYQVFREPNTYVHL